MTDFALEHLMVALDREMSKAILAVMKRVHLCNGCGSPIIDDECWKCGRKEIVDNAS